jgi:hypothetical protein
VDRPPNIIQLPQRFLGLVLPRDYALANREIRQEVLGSHAPALTVIITGIFDEKWLLEIEAPAAV